MPPRSLEARQRGHHRGVRSAARRCQAELLAEVNKHETERNLHLVMTEFRNYQRGILPTGPGTNELIDFFATVDGALGQAITDAPKVQHSDREVLNLLTKRANVLHLGTANYCWFTDPSRAQCLKLAGTPTAQWPLTGMCDSALAVLSPAIAALVGIGAVAVWRAGRTVRAAASAVVGVSVGYQIGLAGHATAPGWLVPVLVTAALAALAALALALVRPGWRALSAALAGVAVVLAPTLAAASVISATLGPFDTPYQPAYYTAYTHLLVTAPEQTRQRTMPALERVRNGARYVLATSNGLLAANIIYVIGEEVLPIGGFTGTFPPPTVDQLRSIGAAGQVHLVIAVGDADDPRIRWIAGHCRQLASRSSGIDEYYCLLADAG